MTFVPEAADMQSWNASFSMDGGATANIVLSNTAEKYAPDDLEWQQIELWFDIDGDLRKWFHGIVQNAQPTFDADGQESISLQCASIFGTLADKPAITKEFDNANAQTVLEALVSTYGSISASFADFSNADKSGSGFEWTRIIVVENSITDALRLIAQANMQELFVRTDGIITTEDYTTNADAAFDIDDKYVMSASAASNSDNPFSRVRVRGGWEDQSDPARVTTLSNSNVQFYFNRLTSNTRVSITFYLSQPDYVWQSAEYTSTTAGVTASFVNMDPPHPNTATIQFAFSPALTAGNHSINLTVTGNKERESQVESLGVGLRPNPKPSNASLLGSLSAIARPVTRLPQTILRSQLSAAEPEIDRIDIEVSDATLASRFGVRWSEVDNTYILSTAIATDIGNRALLEYKQAENTWRVRLSYVPALITEIGLNRRVRFYPPNSATQVDGVVRAMSVGYNATSADASLDLDVEQFYAAP